MRLCSEQLLRIRRRKKANLGKIGNRRRLKHGRNCLNPTQAIYIPVDLQIDILLRLPVRSLLRFRCVSKRWSSIIASRDFRNRYAKSNTAAPSGLLVSLGDFYSNKLMVVSSPNSEGEEKDVVSVSCRDRDVLRIEGGMVCGAVRGLICFRNGYKTVGICNPSTRQIQNLPKLKFNRDPDFDITPNYFLGHDPVEDEYKVLAIDNVTWRLEHKVVVLGGGGAWKEASCAACPHTATTSGICLNGYIYYGADRTDIDHPGPDNPSVIVCFDVRLEKFNIIKVPLPLGCTDLWYSTESTLTNYRGKVCVVEHPRCGTANFRMWVLEDAEKQEWSMVNFLLPKSALDLDFNVTGFVSATEIGLVPRDLSVPFCLYFYNLQRHSIRKVRFEGLPVRKLKRAKLSFITASLHSQSIMFLQT